jgi:uncharacterized protein
MRLTPQQENHICQTVADIIGADARVWLFGSRCNEAARGGDVDLLIEHAVPPSTLLRARVKIALEAALVLPVDIVAMQRGKPPTAFQRIALAKGILLNGGA